MAECASNQEWSRDTLWRQGSVLLKEKALELGLILQSNEAECVIAISHDCDIASDNLAQEPSIEFIIGKIISGLDGNYTYAKSSRTLHFELTCSETVTCVELRAINKKIVSKVALDDCCLDATYQILPDAKSLLQHWLSVRYNRSAFSNEFIDVISNAKIKPKLSRVLESYSQDITGIYFDVDNGHDLDHSDGSLYTLNIILSFHPDANFDTADLEGKVSKVFENAFYSQDSEDWHILQLVTCLCIGEQDITVHQARNFKSWDLDHLSFKGDLISTLPY